MKFITGRSDEETQPWARQSLVQLAPVLGRITDPQTVQTTTSDQSEQSVQQSSTGMQQPVHANHRNTYHLTLNVITSMLNAQQTCLLVYSYTAVVIILTMWDILLHKKKTSSLLHYQAKTTKKTKKTLVHQHTIDFVGTVDHSVCSMCVPDQIHAILFTVESPLGSANKQPYGLLK